MGLPSQSFSGNVHCIRVRRKDLSYVLHLAKYIECLFSVRLSQENDTNNDEKSDVEFAYLNVATEGGKIIPNIVKSIQKYVDSVVYTEKEEEEGRETERRSDGLEGCDPLTSSAGGGEDSSYDSDCENEASGGGSSKRASSPAPHDGVSRTASDTLGAEFAEYVTAAVTTLPAFASSASSPTTAEADPSSSYNARVEFGLKLGYTEKLVNVALQKLGPNPAQNELLAELIRLGAQQTATPSRGHPDTTFPLAGGSSGAGSQSVVPSPHQPSSNVVPSCNSPSPRPIISTANIIGPPIIDRSGEEVDGAKDTATFHASDPSCRLRPIVVDGSNVAMGHGNKEVFSCRGIKLCVDWFKARGHKEITVFVPKWRKEASRPYHHITEQELLNELERERLLVFTPSRLVGGKRMVCYDDRYILRLAAEIDGIVVSNDNYRDLAQENPEFRKVVEERILMYSFVNDRFMPPDDPLGRSGPTLDKFLSYHPVKRLETPPPCPYGKKCTYGNKCRFHHPERGPLPHKSVTERLLEHAQKQLLEVKARASLCGSTGNDIKGKSLSLPLQPVSEPENVSSKRMHKKMPLSRTRSTVLNTMGPLHPSMDGDSHQSQLSRSTGLSLPSCCHIENSSVENGRMSSSHKLNMPQDIQSFSSYHSPSPAFTQLHRMAQVHPMHCRHQWSQLVNSDPSNGAAWPRTTLTYGEQNSVRERSPDQDRSGEEVNLHRKLQRQLTLNPSCDPRLYHLQGYASSHEHQPLARHASGEAHYPRVPTSPIHHATHQNVTRIASAPDSFQQWPPVPHSGSRSHGHRLLMHAPLPRRHQMQRLSSTSDPQLNLGSEGDAASADPFDGGAWFPCTSEPPPSMWSPTVQQMQSRPSGVAPPMPHQSYASDESGDARRRLYYHLSSIFPEDHVRMAMDLYPDETNPQKICAAILSMFPKS